MKCNILVAWTITRNPRWYPRVSWDSGVTDELFFGFWLHRFYRFGTEG